MLSRAVLGFSVVLLIADYAQAQKAKPDPKKELALLQGEWTLESRERDGIKSKTTATLTIKNDQWTYLTTTPIPKGLEKTLPKGGIKASPVPFKIDPSKDPKQIDFPVDANATAKGLFKPIENVGIYKMEGDTLTVCLKDKSVGGRPTEFDSKDKAELYVWKRVKK